MVGNVLEVPASVRHYTRYLSKDGNIKHRIRTILKSGESWLRVALTILNDMKKFITDIDAKSFNDHLEFMVHSSELMHGRSLYFNILRRMKIMIRCMTHEATFSPFPDSWVM